MKTTVARAFILLLLMQSSLMASADVAVSGVVKDQNGNVLEGVVIRIKGTHLAAITNSRGEYKLEVPDNATLVYSFIGLKTVEKRVNDGLSNVDVSLEDDSQQLAQKIVFGSFF